MSESSAVSLGWVALSGRIGAAALLALAAGCGQTVSETLDEVVEDLAETGRPPRDAGDRADAGEADAGPQDPDADGGIDAAVDSEGSGDDGADVVEETTPPVDADGGAEPDVADATDTTTAPDVPRPPGCGNGVREGAEECDDGNDDNTDTCSNLCVSASCGDAILNRTFGRETFESPTVTVPSGASGYVCDDGATCPEGECDLSRVHYAPEHGICQALGFEQAASVIWGDGLGGGAGVSTVYASAWECFDFSCFDSELAPPSTACDSFEMLQSIVCEGVVGEECDDGDANGDIADACRADCTLPFCGDAIVDSDEECDDGNRVNEDGCSNNCLEPQCGDGVVQGDEECDDANEVDTDACLTSCTLPTCGDGIRSIFERTDTLVAPTVTNPAGRSGRVCDDGATCTNTTCDVSLNGAAPEHGICEALGYDQAMSVTWGGGPGESDNPMPHAYNWLCAAFDCTASTNPYDSDNCSSFEMLASIVCRGGMTEECDAGALNSDTPGSLCRTDCTLPACGDGVVDAGEECDDGNEIPTDGCSNSCRLPQCGDGVVQVAFGEECDDGNDVDTDTCTSICEFGPTYVPCGDGDLDSAVGPSVASGTTVGASSSLSASCGASAGSPDLAFSWTAPATRSYRFDTIGSSFDTVLHARNLGTGASCDGAELACNDDSSGVQSVITISATAGQRILIVVDGYSSGSTGSYVLNITAL